MHLLLVEDDPPTADFVRAGLVARGHDVTVAGDGREAVIALARGGFEVAVLDRLLPEFDGLAVLRAVRSAGVSTPVIFLTALGGVSDRVEGLKAGGDDYLVKPFDLDELDARIHALGRRPPLSPALTLRQGGLTLDRLSRRVCAGERELPLTASEYQILELLMVSAGRLVTKAMILEQVFDLDRRSPGMVIEPHVSRLRAKLADAGAPEVIRTHRGRGYSFDAD